MAEDGLVVAPPGWFSDPAGLSDLRWWSGADWTEHVAPSPVMHPADIPRPGTLLTDDSIAVPLPGSLLPAQPATSAYVPFGGARAGDDARGSDAWGGAAYPHATSPDPRDWMPGFAAPTRWNTPGAWALSLSPWIGVLAGLGASLAGHEVSNLWWPVAAISLLPLLWSIATASRDRKRLEGFGYARLPSLWWLLLGPLGYLIARTVQVRRQSGHGSAPLWWYGVHSVIVIALIIGAVVLLAAYLGGSALPTRLPGA